MDAQTQRWITVLATGDPFLMAIAKTLLDNAGILYMASVDNPHPLSELSHASPRWSPIAGSTELRITHEELSGMVGTTHSRISLFMQRFHHLGLIETNTDRFLVIKENKLAAYLAQIA